MSKKNFCDKIVISNEGVKMKKDIIISVCIIGIIISSVLYSFISVNKKIENIDLKKARKLMIVAHPDDETIWGGAHLLDDDYLVVCITCGNSVRRNYEFKKVMKYTKDQFIALGYPDKPKGVKSDWVNLEEGLYDDLKEIITAKSWDLIVTHNKEGEYGHIHHKKTNKIVTDIYNDLKLKEDLYYFGKYYTKKKIKNYEQELTPIDPEKAKIKNEKLMEVYKSQYFIKDILGHMFNYEMWEKYEKDKIIED